MRRHSMILAAAVFMAAAWAHAQTHAARRPVVPTSSSSQLVAIIPVAISSPGRFDSLFKTEVQIHNPNLSTIAFRLVFHAAGIPGKSTDPHLDITIPPLSTLYFPDLLPAMSQSGIGSVDVIALTTFYTAAGTIRVFNDAGAAGTSGFTEPFLDLEDYLDSGISAVLICPPDPSLQRFNVGLRTMGEGATAQVTVRNASGQTIAEFNRSYSPQYFEQTDVAAFLGGIAPPGNSTITVRVLSGGLYLYGVSADNRTNDPSMQVPPAMD